MTVSSKTKAKSRSLQDKAGLSLPVTPIRRHLRKGKGVKLAVGHATAVHYAAYLEYIGRQLLLKCGEQSRRLSLPDKDGVYHMLPCHLNAVATNDKTGVWAILLKNVATTSPMQVRPLDDGVLAGNKLRSLALRTKKAAAASASASAAETESSSE